MKNIERLDFDRDFSEAGTRSIALNDGGKVLYGLKGVKKLFRNVSTANGEIGLH